MNQKHHNFLSFDVEFYNEGEGKFTITLRGEPNIDTRLLYRFNDDDKEISFDELRKVFKCSEFSRNQKVYFYVKNPENDMESPVILDVSRMFPSFGPGFKGRPRQICTSVIRSME